jgi:hypothetical protein
MVAALEPLHVLLMPGPDAWAGSGGGRFVSFGQHSVTALSGPHLYWRMK